MRKVQNGRCIANISKKSIQANKKRNSILLAAIILTTVMLSTLFTVASSLIKSLETGNLLSGRYIYTCRFQVSDTGRV